ncbi:MAG: hypothetical protein GX801_06475, partial [Fibrobacter sp.]|nr:hypothetical protein [Fibrobacter sp.]
MNKYFITMIVVIFGCLWAGNKPMESVTRYNVILVHGASDRWGGMDCNAENFPEAYRSPRDSVTGYFEMVGGIQNGDWKSSAAKMLRALVPWLSDTILEDKNVVYLQRPLTQPAGSPLQNASEIGDRKWKGKGGCAARRSLFEEAQEIRANDQKELATKRSSMAYRLIPSRNIIIAHSMGGVTSREYIRSKSYNNDVDKVITLDSPHEGTGSLNLLLDINDDLRAVVETGTNAIPLAIATSITMASIGKEPGTIIPAILGLAESIALNGMNYGTRLAIMNSLKPKGFDFTKDDALADYIDPIAHNSSGIDNLINERISDSLPMFRLLGGRNSMVFTDPNVGWRTPSNVFIPAAITVPFANVWAQSTGASSQKTNFINALTGFTVGLLGGITLEDHGTALIPEWSSLAKNTPLLNNQKVDVKRMQYDGDIFAKSADATFAASLTGLGAAIIALDVALSWNYPIATGAKVGLAIAGSTLLSAGIVTATMIGVEDIQMSHKAPSLSEYQAQWFGNPSTYNLLTGKQSTITPYLMEDFLYEKPFVNLRVSSANDFTEVPDSTNQDSLGLYYNCDSNVCQSLAVIAPDTTKKYPLTFKNAYDWEKMGVKIDTWTRVSGVDGTVPIRHVNRYAMPDVVVEDNINRYSFVVDDLMPHRLRQIRINFNFVEDLAWECDISKAEDAQDACDVYTRSGGSDWVKKDKKVAHPVKKDGSFDLNMGDYYKSLLGVQKDNQNTVTISTVNKIGLSNTQRFHYLFKATANFIQPRWPLPGVAVSKIDSFVTYASTLDYQGYAVKSGQDCIFIDHLDSASCVESSYVNMTLDGADGGALLFSNNKADSVEYSGPMLWSLQINTENSSGNSNDELIIPFKLDQRPPEITINAEAAVLNPDSTAFMARFYNNISVDPSLRLVRMKLERLQNNTPSKTWDLPLFTNVLSHEFAIDWTGLDKESLSDGVYRLIALALDNAAPNRSLHEAVNNVVSLASSPIDSDQFKRDWYNIASPDSPWILRDGLNSTTDTATFVIDRTAPTVSVDALTANTSSNSRYPQSETKRSGWVTLNKYQTLAADYAVQEPMLQRDTALVSLLWRFTSLNDSNQSHQAGMEQIITSDNAVSGVWEESAQNLIPEGDYQLRLLARDAAGNVNSAAAALKVRIDRTAPQVENLIASQLVYVNTYDTVKASFSVSQAADLDSNRSDLQCYYRVRGAGVAHSDWVLTGTDTKSQSSTSNYKSKIDFVVDPAMLVNATGKMYLEAGCLDAVGNFGFSTDLFHFGALYPTIISPDSTGELANEFVVITGIAHPPQDANIKAIEGNGGYRLRWRNFVSSTWTTEGLDVGAGKRKSAETPWLSNEAQPAEGVLGIWDRRSLPYGDYMLELASQSCDTCPWVTDSMKVILTDVAPDTVSKLVLTVVDSMQAGHEIAISMNMVGATADFSGRIYAQDKSGTAMFEVSTEKIKASPYVGPPVNPGRQDGIWFWSQDDKYYLQWQGLAADDTLKINFKDGAIESLCYDGAATPVANCRVEDNQASSSTTNWNLVDSSIQGNLSEYFQIPADLNKTMVLYGAAGYVTFNSSSAFYIDLNSLWDSTGAMALPYWLGGATEASTVASGVSFAMPFISVNPQLYGLSTNWDGMSSTGHFPQGGEVTIYAESYENAMYGKVFRDSVTIKVSLPNLKLVSDTKDLGEFYVLQDMQEMAKSPVVGKKQLSYGVYGRNARVSAWIEDGFGKNIRNLLDNIPQKATSSKQAYTVAWDGVNEQGHLVTTPDTYTFVISAQEEGGSQPATLRVPFRLTVPSSVVEVVDDGSTASSKSGLRVAEAVADPDYDGAYLYAPQADYLIKANLQGKYLPDSLRKVSLEHSVTGTQNAIGYPPQRFSLAVKRQRDRLDLVIVYMVDRTLEKTTYPGCKQEPAYDEVFIQAESMLFTASDSVHEIVVDLPAGDNRGFYAPSMDTAKIRMIALMRKDWEAFRKEMPTGWGNNIRETFKELSDKKAIWSARDPYGNDGIQIPKVHTTNKVNISPGDVNCVVSDSLKNVCTYTTDGYNPNQNLFKIGMYSDHENFYYNYKYVRPGVPTCYTKRYQSLGFKVQLTIPDDYWNAGYGYDNLVNRTLRFDQTNLTMFGESSSYLSALKSLADTNDNFKPIFNHLFHDGAKWNSNTNYGRLTPFEVHNFPFISANAFPSPQNTFLLPDEVGGFEYPSYLHAKFYGKNEVGSFVAKILGKPVHENTCPKWDADGRCEITLVNKRESSVSTPLLQHGNINIMVGLNAQKSDYDSKYTVTIPKPAPMNWMESLHDTVKCPAHTDAIWTSNENAFASCQKFYTVGSYVNYHTGDYSPEKWDSVMLDNFTNKYLANQINKPGQALYIDSLNIFPNFNAALAGKEAITTTTEVEFSPKNYENGVFYILQGLGRPEYNAAYSETITTKVVNVDSSLVWWNASEKRLEAKAQDWMDPALDSNKVIYRRTLDKINEQTIPPSTKKALGFSLEDLYFGQVGIKDRLEPGLSLYDSLNERNNWIKEVKLASPALTHLDSTVHTHFTVSATPGDTVVNIVRKDATTNIRAKELVAIHGQVPAGQNYQLAYLYKGAIENIASDTMPTISAHDSIYGGTFAGLPRLNWFDVNRLQGNTSLMLFWQEEPSSQLNFRKLDLNIGTPVRDSIDSKTVTSIFGELSVSFDNVVTDEKRMDVTVRVANPSDYGFEVFNGAPLRGPVMEVLPSMTFAEGSYPRVKMVIAREEIEEYEQDPSRIRLYKVDFANQQFVPLQNVLYGYLTKDDTDINKVNECDKPFSSLCYKDDNWTHLLVSGETSTFSAFVALDYQNVGSGGVEFSLHPQVGTELRRHILVSGAESYNIYLDDDPIWGDSTDATPPELLSVHTDSLGKPYIYLPQRTDSWLYLVPKYQGAELADAPLRVHAQVVPANMLCTMPDTLLWLGLDNGYLELAQSCNQGGVGTLQLRQDNKVKAEIYQSLPDPFHWDGSLGVNKIKFGSYQSRYIGLAFTEAQTQIAGPEIRTDSLRPRISHWSV